MAEGPALEFDIGQAGEGPALEFDVGPPGGVVVVGPPPASDAVPNLIADRAWRLITATGLVGVDAESDRLMEGIIRGMLDPALPLSLAAHGDGDAGAWERLTNPDRAGLEDLPYAVQWTGATVAPRIEGEADADYLTRARVEARRPRGMFRGSPRALLDVAQPFLTGTHEPRIVADAGGDLWTALFLIASAGVLDSVRLEQALNAPDIVAAGMKVLLVISDATVWDEAETTWDAATGTWDTFRES